MYGHTPTPEPEWLNRTINIDQGCVFGGKLTALRYPEREIVSVPARRTWYEPVKPFLPPEQSAPEAPSLQWQHDEVLDIADFVGKHVIPTPLDRTITVRAEHAAAALEVISRFAVDFRWLLYLPPTMSPTETSSRPGSSSIRTRRSRTSDIRAFPRSFAKRSTWALGQCSVLCRDEAAGLERFGRRGASGAVLHEDRPSVLPPRDDYGSCSRALRPSFSTAGLWERSSPPLDRARLRGDAVEPEGAGAAPNAVCSGRGRPPRRGFGGRDALRSGRPRSWAFAISSSAAVGRKARGEVQGGNRHYCWNVKWPRRHRYRAFSRCSPSEGRTFLRSATTSGTWTKAAIDGRRPTRSWKPTAWRARRCPRRSQPVRAGVDWWTELTAAGGEGFVVKPLVHLVARSESGSCSLRLKCRGPEYLRIIYGPELRASRANLERLRQRGLGSQARPCSRGSSRSGVEGDRALRSARAFAPSTRVRLRRPRPRERAGRSAAVATREWTSPAGAAGSTPSAVTGPDSLFPGWVKASSRSFSQRGVAERARPRAMGCPARSRRSRRRILSASVHALRGGQRCSPRPAASARPRRCR